MMDINPNTFYFLAPYKEKFILLKDIAEAFSYYIDRKVCLISGEIFPLGRGDIFDLFKNISLEKSFIQPRVIHLNYELGYLLQNPDIEISKDDLLFYDLNFSSAELLDLEGNDKKIEARVESIVNKEEYRKKFEEGYEHLLKGDCYQFNLTCPFKIHLNDMSNSLDLAKAIWKNKSSRGAYASLTQMNDMALISNSPECLFQIEGTSLESMPIKGTISLGPKSIESAWKELRSCKKNQSELNMITDLLRHDLSSIGENRSKVCDLNKALLVPGLIHQYSRLKVELSKDVNLLQVLSALFPGGSITGAPKKRVMNIIRNIEKRPRGFYCGSTVFLYKQLKAASINIRSGKFFRAEQAIHYHAGGGITVASDMESEHQEMLDKVKSFSSILG
jgi:para-aminobenzoate synthetase component I